MIVMLVFGKSSPEAPLVVEAVAGASLVLTERDISGIDRRGSVDSHHWRMTFSFLTHPLVNSNMFKEGTNLEKMQRVQMWIIRE